MPWPILRRRVIPISRPYLEILQKSTDRCQVSRGLKLSDNNGVEQPDHAVWRAALTKIPLLLEENIASRAGV